ncbi:MAG: hypothetical protein V8Q42_03550 [Anaerovoracaceae bacterium]
MGVAVTFVMVLTTAATWPIYNGILLNIGAGYLQTVVSSSLSQLSTAG